MLENKEPKNTSKRLELALTGREVLEGYKGPLVEWPGELNLPPIPPLEWAAEQYVDRQFRVPSLEVEDLDIPQAWLSRQMAKDRRIRRRSIPGLVAGSVDIVRTMMAPLIGSSKPLESTYVHRFLGYSSQHLLGLLMERHPGIHSKRVRLQQSGDPFKVAINLAPPFKGPIILPGGSAKNLSGFAEYDERYYVKKLEEWESDSGLEAGDLAVMGWVIALCRSKNELWVPPETKSWYMRLLLYFNWWLEKADVPLDVPLDVPVDVPLDVPLDDPWDDPVYH